MKKIFILLLAISTSTYGSFYKLKISRVDHDLYRTFDGQYLIKTSLCLELPILEDVILVYSYPHHYDNKIIFKSGKSCRVEEVYKL